MQYLKQSTAVDVMLGPFVDDTDGKTTEEALALAQADLQLSKNCGAAAQKGDATSATHIYGGNYKVPLSTTDTDTLGRLDIMCKASGALPIMKSFMVVTPNWYDTMFSTDILDVNVTHVAGTAQTPNDNGADINAILEDTSEIGVAGAGLTAISLPDQTMNITGNITGNLSGSVGSVTAAVTTDAASRTASQADISSLATAAELAKVPKSDGTSSWNATALGAINNEVATALSDIHLDHLLATDYDPASKPGTATALLNELVEDDAGVSRFTVNALENAPSGTGASAAAIADAVWDEAIADHTTSTTFGGKNQKVVPSETVNDYKADVSGLATSAALTTHDGKLDTVDTNVDLILEDTGTTLPAAIADVPTVAEFNARTQPTADYFDPATDTVATVTSVTNQVTADVTAISGSTDAADNLEASAKTIVTGTATGTPTTTTMSTDLTEATDDHYNGRIIIWTSGVLKDQATNITDYTGTTGTLTFTAVTEAASSGDTFVIV